MDLSDSNSNKRLVSEMDFSPRPNSLVSSGVFNLPVANNAAEEADPAVPSVGAISLDSSPGNFPILRDGSPSPNANSVFNSTLATMDSIDSDLRTLSSEEETVKKLSFDLDPLYKSSLEDEEQDTTVDAALLQDRIQLICDLVRQPFIDGEIWYVVSAAFYKKFINTEPDFSLAFGNFDIVDPVTKRLRPDALTQLVPSQAWQHFVSWFPSVNHFALPRKIITENNMLTIEIFPYELIVKPYSLLTSFPQQELVTLSKTDTLTDLRERVTQKFGITGGDASIRFWHVAKTFGALLDTLLSNSGDTAFAPRSFKSTIGRFNASFSGYQQQDSQEFLAFLLDGLHEDLNRIHKKPATEKPELKDDSSGNTQAIIDLANESWRVHKLRNESVILDLFGGLYKSTLVCPECNMTSITFDPFMDLTLPLPSGQIWSKDIYVFPRVGRPVILSVELSQSATGQQLKQYICDKLNLDIDAIHFAEIFNGMFYKNLGKIDSVTEISTSDNEIVACYELDFKIEDFDSDTDLIIPVYFEMESSESHFKAISIPFYIYLNTTEAEDPSIIQQKVLSKAAQFNNTSEAALKNIDLSYLPFTLSYHTVHNSDVPATEWRIFRRSLKPLVTPIVEVAEEQSSSNVSMVTPESNSSLSEPDTALEAVKVTQDDTEISNDVEFPEDIKLPEEIKLSDDISDELETEPQDLQKDSANTLYDPLNNQFEDAIPDLDELPDTFPPNIVASGNDDINDDIDNDDLLEGTKSPKGSELPDDSSRPISPAVSDLSDEDKGFENLGTMFDDDDGNTSSRASLMGPPPVYSNYNQQRTGALLESHDVLICTWNPQAYVEIFGQEYVNATIETVSDPELEKHRAERQRKKEQGIPLSDCLDQFSKTEVLGEDDLWHCSRCKDFRRASKTIELWKIPDIFTIHLKRFSSYHGMGDKLDDLVNFPIEGLDMTDRIQKTKYGGKVEETIEEGGQIYDLFGVDNHYGGLGGGHYTAFAKNFVDNEWYYFDDSRVRKADPEDSITSAAYLLFYRRRSADLLGGEELKKILEYVEQNREVEGIPDNISSAEESTGAVEPFQGPGRLLGTSETPNPVSVPWNPTTKLNIEPSESESEDEDLEDEDEEDEDDTKDEAYSPASESNFSNVSD
ncbi:hypothetical protein D0Z00_003040 [Geotrichum galactomycetum]|uniref:Uncharacterized protein n=1 Tax=Geotrichum galactomycetum TaxID=27317 RepID=A0ACB6V2E4_9ASCO|nr:hypothetical protein D0Z00_003040 [Geotrichum candidum]